jgi:hypothetical protein
MTELTCPVCQRPQVTTNNCPNCEANLESLQILAQLPVSPTPRPSWYLWLSLAMNCGLAGLLLTMLLGAN